jgi:hypothetical protein
MPPSMWYSEMGYLFSLLASMSKATTETFLNISELVILGSGFLLAFGAIGEYLVEHGKLLTWIRWPKIVFVVMVVVSLIGEFLGDAGVYIFSSHLQTISDQELGDVIDENTDLRTFMQPRRAMGFKLASDREGLTLVDNLREFTGVHLFIQSLPDTEPSILANDIAFLLTGMKWNVRLVGPGETRIALARMQPGVRVFTWRPKQVPPSSHIGARDRGWAAGEALTKYLDSEIPFVSHPDVSSMQIERFAPFGFNPPEDAVVVFIGPRDMVFETAVIRDRRVKKLKAAQAKSPASRK